MADADANGGAIPIKKVNVSEHTKNIFKEGELDLVATVRKFRIVASDVKNHEVNCYNIDMIISFSYRIKPSIATKFYISG